MESLNFILSNTLIISKQTNDFQIETQSRNLFYNETYRKLNLFTVCVVWVVSGKWIHSIISIPTFDRVDYIQGQKTKIKSKRLCLAMKYLF